MERVHYFQLDSSIVKLSLKNMLPVLSCIVSPRIIQDNLEITSISCSVMNRSRIGVSKKLTLRERDQYN